MLTLSMHLIDNMLSILSLIPVTLHLAEVIFFLLTILMLKILFHNLRYWGKLPKDTKQLFINDLDQIRLILTKLLDYHSYKKMECQIVSYFLYIEITANITCMLLQDRIVNSEQLLLQLLLYDYTC